MGSERETRKELLERAREKSKRSRKQGKLKTKRNKEKKDVPEKHRLTRNYTSTLFNALSRVSPLLASTILPSQVNQAAPNIKEIF